MKSDLYETTTARIIAEMESGILPWSRPWHGAVGLPVNAISGRKYSGVNVLQLWAAGMSYSSPRWLTYKQAQAAGGNDEAAPTTEDDMSTREFEHYQGCKHRDPDNCGGCALTTGGADGPNYAAWPLAYMENGRAIPAKWREAFKAEMASDNLPYAENVKATMERLGVRFTDGAPL